MDGYIVNKEFKIFLIYLRIRTHLNVGLAVKDQLFLPVVTERIIPAIKLGVELRPSET